MRLDSNSNTNEVHASTVAKLYGEKLTWRSSSSNPDIYVTDILAGTDEVRKGVVRGVPVDEITSEWDTEAATFSEMSKKYWLYDRESSTAAESA